MSFTETIKKEMKTYFPGFPFLETRKGSGPVPKFQRSETRETPYLFQTIEFQKNPYLNSVYAAVGNHYLALAKNQERCFYVVLAAKRAENSFQSFDFQTTEDIKKWFQCHHLGLLKAAEEEWQYYLQHYKEIAEYYDSLLPEYTKWFQKIGKDLNPESYQMEGNAYEQFLEYLRAKEFLLKKRQWQAQQKELTFEQENLDIWHFWGQGRPLHKASFIKGELYDCILCKEFKARGDLIEKKDPLFGVNYEFICKKCAAKAN